MKQIARVVGFGCVCAAPVFAEPDFDALLFRALRYGDSPERRDEKARARAELDALGADALRAMMARAHFENLMLHVVALEFVQHQVPAEQGTPILRQSLESPHEQTRRAAAFMLGFYPRDDASIPTLLAMLDRERERNPALRTLGIWRVDAARDAVHALLRAESERTRIFAANALSRLGNPEDLPALIDALGDPAFLVRNTAARAILAHGRAALPALRAALPDAEGARLRQLIRILGAQADPDDRERIAQWTDHIDPDVRADAAWALARIEGRAPAEGRLLEEPLF